MNEIARNNPKDNLTKKSFNNGKKSFAGQNKRSPSGKPRSK